MLIAVSTTGNILAHEIMRKNCESVSQGNKTFAELSQMVHKQPYKIVKTRTPAGKR